MVFVLAAAGQPQKGFAVVGQAEQYDPFEQANLDEFHSEVQKEERQRQLDRAQAMAAVMNPQGGTAAPQAVQGESAMTDKELKELQKELLQVPKRDRWRGGFDGQYKFDSNVKRAGPGYEKSDSIFDELSFSEFDLSGKKTDLRFELRGARQWNIKFSEKDYWYVEEALRYRKKYFKKITHSQQSRIARHSSKTIEMNANKIRYDSNQIMAMNFQMTRRFSTNMEVSHIKRFFTQKAFRNDSDWQFGLHPAAFWLITPKSRIQAGYRFGADRIRTKAGNANSHEIHAGYFGRVTKKSSVSLDLSVSHQSPRCQETPIVNIFTVGVGSIYQLSSKTQLTAQFIRSLQNTSSNLVSGKVDSKDSVVSKSTEFFTNDSLSLTLNSRLTRKLSANLTLNASIMGTQVEKGGDKDNNNTQFSFPSTLEVSYFLHRWIRLAVAYTFSYRTGRLKPDTYREHLWNAKMQVSF